MSKIIIREFPAISSDKLEQRLIEEWTIIDACCWCWTQGSTHRLDNLDLISFNNLIFIQPITGTIAMNLTPLDPTHALEQERIQIYRERRRQARISFNLALGISTFISLVGAVQLLIGHTPEGSLTASTGVGASILCFRFAKDANDRLDKLTTELKDK